MLILFIFVCNMPHLLCQKLAYHEKLIYVPQLSITGKFIMTLTNSAHYGASQMRPQYEKCL